MTDEVVLQIREFDVHSIYPRDVKDYDQGGSRIIIIAAPGKGKSFCAKSIAYQKRYQFPVVCVVNGNEDHNHMYAAHVPETMLHTELSDEVIESVRQRQSVAIKHLPQPWLLFIKDDCIDSSTHFKRAAIETFYKRERQWNVVSILCLHYAVELSKPIRTCIDYVFIFREPNRETRETLYKNFAGIIPTFKLFCQLMDEITGDYTALVIANREQSNDPMDCVFWYKAPPFPKDFKLGCEDMWLFDEQRCYHEEDEK